MQVEYTEGRDKPAALIRHLNGIQDGLILVFVETKRSADRLEYELSNDGYPATSIHGDRTQREREEALSQFKNGLKPILVATDVASRGLDISGVTHVFNYDMPGNIEDYVHRIGRTGRVGNTGVAISFVNDDNRAIARELHDLLAENGQEIPPFLAAMAGPGSAFAGSGRYGGRGGGRGSRGGGRSGPAFGARDVRRESGGGGGGGAPRSGGGGPRGGGGGGGRGGGGGGPSASADNSAW